MNDRICKINFLAVCKVLVHNRYELDWVGQNLAQIEKWQISSTHFVPRLEWVGITCLPTLGKEDR